MKRPRAPATGSESGSGVVKERLKLKEMVNAVVLRRRWRLWKRLLRCLELRGGSGKGREWVLDL